MAKIRQCHVWANAKQYRLVSDKTAYTFQILYHIKKCKGHTEVRKPDGTVEVHLCTAEHMQWRGEYQDETFTQFIDIEPQHFEKWKKRAEKDQARPEVQMTSEYSKTIKKSGPQVLAYLLKLDRAQQWWQGKRVES